VPVPADAHGFLYVATNDAIPVGVEGTDVALEQDVGGYYLIHRRDLDALMTAIQQEPEPKPPAAVPPPPATP